MKALITSRLLAPSAMCAALSGALLTCGACGGSPPPPAEEPQAAEPDEGGGHKPRAVPGIESEIGALDETKVKQTFEQVSGKLSACFNQGTQRLAYLAGDVRLVVRVAKDGAPRWAYVKDSTLGDRETEACMLEALKAATWPKPEGGEGLAENSFSFEPGGDERPPIAWSPQQLGAPYRGAKAALDRCRKKAGTKGLKATMYVETDGKPSAVGVSSADERGEAAAPCVVDALRAIKFPSPGSYAAKVSVVIE
jgi:hypothetical protein